MSSHSSLAQTTETRALELLGLGANPSQVASALGVSESLISQFLSQDHFAKQVTELRFQNLLKHSKRDEKLDALEDALIKKLENIIPFMHKPHEIIQAFTRVNAAKRRGASSPEHIQQSQPVINLTLPVQIIQSVQVNSANQVIKAGEQELITVQSGRLANLLPSALPGAKNVLSHAAGTENVATSRN